MEEKAKALTKEQAAAKDEERQDALEADMQSHTGDKHTPIYKALSNQKKLSFMRGIANAFAFRG